MHLRGRSKVSAWKRSEQSMPGIRLYCWKSAPEWRMSVRVAIKRSGIRRKKTFLLTFAMPGLPGTAEHRWTAALRRRGLKGAPIWTSQRLRCDVLQASSVADFVFVGADFHRNNGIATRLEKSLPLLAATPQ